MINKYDPDIFTISETWFVPGTHFRLPGYSCLRDDRGDGYAGAAIFVKHSHTFSRIALPSTLSDMNILAVKV
jgi:exonuclease III